MSLERPDFMESFNAVEVPPTMIVQDEFDAAQYQRDFLKEIQDSLVLSDRALGAFFDEETKLLLPYAKQEALRRGESGMMTDDYITLFRHRGRHALASVMLIRDDFNYTVVHFAKYPILPPIEACIRNYQQGDEFDNRLYESVPE